MIAETKLRLENGGVVFVDLCRGRFVLRQAAADMSAFKDVAAEDGLRAVVRTCEPVAWFLRAYESSK